MEPKCNQQGCKEPPLYRYTWPGRNEALCCEAHSRAVRNIASAMGLYVELIPFERETVNG